VYITLEVMMSLLLGMIYAATEVFRIQVVGMSPLQLVLIGTALEASAFLLEVPTGVVADSRSRKLSVILGVSLLGLNFVLMALFPTFIIQLAIQLIGALGYTFMSGAQQAWITDEIGEEAAAKAFMRASQLGTLGSLAGIVTTILLGSINVAIPILLGGMLMIAFAVVLVTVMPEDGFKPTPKGDRSTFQHMWGTFREGGRVVRGNRVLLTIILLSAIVGAWSESYDRMNTTHFIHSVGLPGTFAPVVWFGIMSLVAMPIHLIVTEVARRRMNTSHQPTVVRTLMALDGILIVSALAFAVAGNFWVAYLASISVGLVRSINEPIRAAWLNQHVPSEVRATVFSMDSQANAIGQVAGGPLFGAIGNVSLRAALALAALLLTPGQWLYWRTLRNDVASSAATSTEGNIPSPSSS
jgi:DHA3 family tetracycline resistance protein-like MFS transporter